MDHMMTGPQDTEGRKAITIEVDDLEGLRKIVDELPEGTIYSVDMEVFSDGQDNG